MTDLHTGLRFYQRPAPVLPEHRPLYKIAQIVLVLLLASRGERSSLARLQLFNWAFKVPERADALADSAINKRLKVSAWGFDPALAIALRYACAEGLIKATNAGYELTESGVEFARSIVSEPNVLTREKHLLNLTRKGITEAMVNEIAKEWDAR